MAIGCCSWVKINFCKCFEKPERKIELHVTSGMRRPGPRHIELEKLKKYMESDEVDIVHINGELNRLSNSPITLTKDVIYISGYLDPQLSLIGTDLKKNLSPYIANHIAFKKVGFAGAAFRKLTIERLALQVIKELNNAYKICMIDVVDLNFIGHSMGARIAEVTAQLINKFPELCSKKFVVHKIISLSGANKGSPVARISSGLFCCSDNVAKDLRPEQIQKYDHEKMRSINTVASYITVYNDQIIPADYSAPPRYPVIVLHGISRLSPHTAILNDPFVKLWILNQLKD
jgi:hypothetical protein